MQKLLLFPFAPPLGVFPAPNIKIKAPSIPHVNPIVLWAISFFSYFVVLSGFIYDIIIEPPSVGSATDASGTVKPVAFLQNRINGQFIIEGLSAGFMFVIGGVGLVILDKSTTKYMLPRNSYLLFIAGVACVFTAYALCNVFIRIKVPGYLS